MSQDRLKASLRALQGLDPMHPYRRIYRAKVLGQSLDLQKVDVRPFDPSLPAMSGIDLRHGVPGIKVQVAPGCSVQIGWDDGKPDKPFAALWSTDASAIKVSLIATQLNLGSDMPIDAAMLGTTYRTAESISNAALLAFLGALAVYIAAIQTTGTDPPGTATTTMASAITAAITPLTALEAGSAGYLSTIAKVAK